MMKIIKKAKNLLIKNKLWMVVIIIITIVAGGFIWKWSLNMLSTNFENHSINVMVNEETTTDGASDLTYWGF